VSRVAIVTGGGTGIGAGAAKLPAQSSWTTGNVIHADGGQVPGLPESAGG